jgi:formylglycine-generating enzyme required for sulfatase activity
MPQQSETQPTEPAPGEVRVDSFGIRQVWVPAGCFLMGSDPEKDPDAYDDEQPQREVCITRGFWLDQFPVTNDAYRAFIDADGYKTERFWSPDGWQWVIRNKKTRPRDYEDFTDPNQPRVGVTWYEVDAYARWRGGCLPTESEWEYAARGPESLIYPWGDVWDSSRANTRESGIGKTTPVEQYEGGKSWVNAYDLAGNVWEWVADWWDENYYKTNPPKNNPTGPASGEERCLRGGSWGIIPLFSRAACRTGLRPVGEFNDFGFRVVYSVPVN